MSGMRGQEVLQIGGRFWINSDAPLRDTAGAGVLSVTMNVLVRTTSSICPGVVVARFPAVTTDVTTGPATGLETSFPRPIHATYKFVIPATARVLSVTGKSHVAG